MYSFFLHSGKKLIALFLMPTSASTTMAYEWIFEWTDETPIDRSTLVLGAINSSSAFCAS